MNIEELRRLYTVPMVLNKYGVKVNKGQALCPFHNEKTASLKVKDSHCHCYGCGRHDDIFSLVMHFENCNFKTALQILGGDKKPTLTARRKSQQLIEQKEKQKQEEAKRQNRLYAGMQKWRELSNIKEKYAPPLYPDLDISKLTDKEFDQLMEETFNPTYAEALHALSYQEYLIDYAL